MCAALSYKIKWGVLPIHGEALTEELDISHSLFVDLLTIQRDTTGQIDLIILGQVATPCQLHQGYCVLFEPEIIEYIGEDVGVGLDHSLNADIASTSSTKTIRINIKLMCSLIEIILDGREE